MKYNSTLYLEDDCMYKDGYIKMCNKYLNFIKENPLKKCINPFYIEDILKLC